MLQCYTLYQNIYHIYKFIILYHFRKLPYFKGVLF